MQYRSFDNPGTGTMHCASGMTVYEEKFTAGKLKTRYLSACGQVLPEMHLPDAELDGIKNSTFRICTDGAELTDWKLEAAEAQKTVLCDASGSVRLTVLTDADGEGWISRRLMIENLTDRLLALRDVMVFAGTIWRHRFVRDNLSYDPAEAGIAADEIYEVGYNALSRWGTEGDFGFRPLQKAFSYDAAMNGRSGWSRPSFVLRDRMNGQLFCCELAYSGNWQMELEPCFEPTFTGLSFAIGLKCPETECLRVLAPGESVTTPAVHFTLCAEGMDALIHSRHRFVREQIMPQSDPIGQCLIEANHRGYLCDRENEADILRDVDVAAAVGAELYVIDAGWFGKEPNVWYKNAGDWFAGPWLPNDLYPIIDRVRQHGMKFGLWMEIEAAGENTDVRKNHPEFLMRRGGEPVCDGRALDLSKKEVVEWLENEISSLITRYKLDMFRIDHNHWLNEAGNRKVGAYTENVLWKYFENLYAMFERLNRRFPNVSFQNCAAGGGRLDLGILRYFHHTEVTDWVRPPRGARIFSGLLTALPPEIQLRTFGTEVAEHVQDADVLSQLHSVMQSRMIFRGIAPSEAFLAPQLRQQISEQLALYKTKLRPILTGKCLVYRHAAQNGVLDACAWSANEFSLPDKSAAFCVVQKLTPDADGFFRLRFSGLSGERRYRVQLVRKKDCFFADGAALMQQGLLVTVGNMLGSELILVTE